MHDACILHACTPCARASTVAAQKTHKSYITHQSVRLRRPCDDGDRARTRRQEVQMPQQKARHEPHDFSILQPYTHDTRSRAQRLSSRTPAAHGVAHTCTPTIDAAYRPPAIRAARKHPTRKLKQYHATLQAYSMHYATMHYATIV